MYPLADFPGAEFLATGQRGIHAWFVRNDRSETEKRCLHWLSAEERARAERFRRWQDRCAYVVTRGALRALLGSTLGYDPAEVPLVTGVHGKPRLPAGSGEALPSFNVSHTSGYSLLALSTVGEVGVDVEVLDRRVESEALSARFFHLAEHSYLRGLPLVDQSDAFFRLWVRKEALAKALGLGLGLDLSAHNLAGSTSGTVTVRVGSVLGAPSGSWRVCDLAAPAGYCAALAHEEVELA